MRLTRSISGSSLSQAIDTIVRQHSMLHPRFSQDELGQWTQAITNDTSSSYSFTEHRFPLNGTEVAALAEHGHATVNAEGGPIYAARLINVLGNHLFLYVATHHLVIDLVSWRTTIMMWKSCWCQDLSRASHLWLGLGASCRLNTPLTYLHYLPSACHAMCIPLIQSTELCRPGRISTPMSCVCEGSAVSQAVTTRLMNDVNDRWCARSS